VSELDTPDEAGGDPATTGDPYDSTEELGPEGERVARVITQRLTRSTLYMGPIPSGEMLESYNAALGQGGAGRVLALAEAQSEHRRHLERRMVESEIDLQQRGQAYGFVLAMTALVAGAVLIGVGKSAAGLVPIIGGLVTLVGLFVYSQRAAKGRRLPVAPGDDEQPRSV